MVKWAEKRVGISLKNAEKLWEAVIDGGALASMTREDFERSGIPIGPAANLFEGLKKLFPERYGSSSVDAPVALTRAFIHLDSLFHSSSFPFHRSSFLSII